MRAAFALLLLAVLGGCGRSLPKSGWEYRPEHGAYGAWLYYRFDDGEGTTLIGTCDGEPSFMIVGGAWTGSEFTLTAGGKSWRFHTMQGEHSHYLEVEGQVANQAIAQETGSFSFQVGNWRREIRAADPLRRFVADCS